MSDKKKTDDLTKTTDSGSIDLTEEELGRVSGGLVNKIKGDFIDKVAPTKEKI